ncbi:MAG TPA: elongation factor G [Planctomycetaceae bacterium]|jgi:elongation factor G|nr:elongation factor G [Planctomycetaceae bacterium]
MAKHPVGDIRNVAFVGHGAVGKTTLSDLMLFKAGAVSRAGSVDDGSSVLDSDDEAKHHKHSITSTLVHFTHGGKYINVLDTPGYPDFIGQAIVALRAVETAVVTLSAAAGIEVNTRRMFNLAGAAGLGRMIAVSKCDLENINFDRLMESIRETFGNACVPMNLPVGLGPKFSGVVSTLEVPSSVPPDTAADPAEWNQAVMDAIVESNESLMERYLNGEQLPPEEVAAGLSKAVAGGTLIPIFFVSAKLGVGIPELMDALARFALSPLELPRKAKNAAGEEVTIVSAPDGPLVAQVFKTRIDSFVAKMSFLRVFSGTLKKDMAIHATQAAKAIKVPQLLEMQGHQHTSLEEATAGDIAVVVKVEDLAVGDTITKDAGTYVMPPIKFPTPMIGLAVEPKSRADQQKISGALQKIAEEDQTFVLSRETQTKEMVIHGMSELHLQMMQERVHKRDKVEMVSKPPKIPYRETVAGHAEGFYRHKKQSGGSGQFAEVHFRISPVPHGIKPEEFFTKDRFVSMRSFHYDPALNYAFVDRVTGGSVPNNFIPAVEKGIKERMEQGVIAGYQVQDVACELFFGKDHPVDSNETAFRTAARMCFRNVFREARPVLLEPIVTAEITVPAEKLGDITSDLNGRRGRVEGMDNAPGGFQVIRAKAPLSEMMTYARSLSSMTGGQGSFTLEFSHYDIVPPNEQQKIVAAAQKHHEEEEE